MPLLLPHAPQFCLEGARQKISIKQAIVTVDGGGFFRTLLI
jgi:hypothetical protein